MANIVILDDEALSLSRLSEVLAGDSRHAVWTAQDSFSCLCRIEDPGFLIDLLMVDVSAAEPGTIDVLGRFQDVRPRGRVLVLTHSLEHPLSRRFQLLRKPFSDNALLESVEEALNSKRSQVDTLMEVFA